MSGANLAAVAATLLPAICLELPRGTESAMVSTCTIPPAPRKLYHVKITASTGFPRTVCAAGGKHGGCGQHRRRGSPSTTRCSCCCAPDSASRYALSCALPELHLPLNSIFRGTPTAPICTRKQHSIYCGIACEPTELSRNTVACAPLSDSKLQCRAAAGADVRGAR